MKSIILKLTKKKKERKKYREANMDLGKKEVRLGKKIKKSFID